MLRIEEWKNKASPDCKRCGSKGCKTCLNGCCYKCCLITQVYEKSDSETCKIKAHDITKVDLEKVKGFYNSKKKFFN